MLLPVVRATVGVNTFSCQGVNENVCQNLCVQGIVIVYECVGRLKNCTNAGVCARECV